MKLLNYPTPIIKVSAQTEEPSSTPVDIPSAIVLGIEAGVSLGIVTLAVLGVNWARKTQAKILCLLEQKPQPKELLDMSVQRDISHWLYCLKDKLEADTISLTLLHNGNTTPYGYHFVKCTTIQQISDSGIRFSKEPNQYYPISFTTDENEDKFFLNQAFSPYTYTRILRIGNIDIGYVNVSYLEARPDIVFLNVNRELQMLTQTLQEETKVNG